MDLRQLRHLIAIIEERSFSAAAKAVHLTQPALTRSMNALEASVGTPLLVRRNNGIEPTSAGAVLYEYANLLTTTADNARADIARLAKGLGGALNVGIGTHLADLALPKILSEFAQRYPHLSINLKIGMIEDLVPMVLEGKVELLASMVPTDRMQQGLAYERLFTTKDHLYSADNHHISQIDDVITFDRLTKERWVSLNCLHADLDMNRFFANGGKGFPSQVFRTDSPRMMRALIEDEGCLGIMPAEYMKSARAQPLRVEGLPIARATGLLYRPDIPLRPIVMEFANLLRRELSSPPG
ncbi:LysR family transcriptional regulator [Novosphingobium guangzhouense]|uniref:HTH lysR-type domain-containing protein n=1 Tax=Novosphingobium guangzhouense TaxID=1850347 RepID=A0A2K2FXF6_9SPHN|nr:LysR family transcriptional regulator [Novosphingobium guangzhouense]PNU03444.1 hypothetical protein A8V01_06980 [Novosphingobium guangzhouense]